MNGPPTRPETVPAVVVPSPQLIVAAKSAMVATGFASRKEPTVPENDCPSVGVIVIGAPALSGASWTVAESLTASVEPPTSFTVTTNGPPTEPETVPAEEVPSPQLIVAEKSAVVAKGFASWKVANVPVNGWPSVGVIVIGASAFSGAS